MIGNILIENPHKINIEYWYGGDSKKGTALFLHGGGANFRWYIPLLEKISEEHYVIAPSLPGFGMSTNSKYGYSYPVILDVIDEISKKLLMNEYIIVGQSMGGGVAAQYLIDRGGNNRIKGAILISPLVYKETRSIFEMNRLLKNSYNNGLTKGEIILNDEDKKFNSNLHNKVKYYINSSRLYRFIRRMDFGSNLESINKPVVAMYSQDDDVLIPEKQYKNIQKIKNVKIKKYTGYGHSMFFAIMEDIIREIDLLYLK